MELLSVTLLSLPVLARVPRAESCPEAGSLAWRPPSPTGDAWMRSMRSREGPACDFVTLPVAEAKEELPQVAGKSQ